MNDRLHETTLISYNRHKTLLLVCCIKSPEKSINESFYASLSQNIKNASYLSIFQDEQIVSNVFFGFLFNAEVHLVLQMAGCFVFIMLLNV